MIWYIMYQEVNDSNVVRAGEGGGVFENSPARDWSTEFQAK